MLRKFLLLAALLVVAHGCSQDTEPSEAAENATAGSALASKVTDQMSLLPSNMNLVFHADLAYLRKTPVGEDLRRQLEAKINEESDDDYLDFVEKTGVDIKKDVDLVWAGAMPAEHDESIGGLIAMGRFDKDRIVDYMREKHRHDFDKLSYRDHDVYTTDDKEGLISFLDSRTVVLGEKTWVEAVIDQFEDKTASILDNPGMSAHIKDMSGKSHLWGVANLEDKSQKWARRLRNGGSGFGGTKSLEHMRSILFYTIMGKEANVVVHGNFSSDEDAKNLADAITGFKALGKMMMSDDREAVDMLNEIKIRSEGPVVEISTRVDSHFINKVKEKGRKLSTGAGKLM